MPVTPSQTLPHQGRAVRGNSGITETQLILGVLTLWAAWVDGRGVVVVAEEAADVKMLFDPAKQQLDLPSGLVEGGDVGRGALEVIGQQGDGFPVGSLNPEPAQSDRQLRIALAGEAHLMILEHGETIT